MTAPQSLGQLVAAFQDRSLPREEWTHLAHLRVGSWHVATYGPDEALTRLRRDIRALNEAHGGANTATGGYHETITRAYIVLLQGFLQQCPAHRSTEAHIDLVESHPVADPMVLRHFYSGDLLMSVRARQEWVEPDKAPISCPG